MSVTRRSFLAAAPAAALLPSTALLPGPTPLPVRAAIQAAVPATFPAHPPELARDMVGSSHANVERVRELLELRPSLANASWDWGFGDWETALGAASHVGTVEIAEMLLAAGARPTIFSATMLGQLDVVKAFVASAPGIQRTRGPHGITLMSHARAGGPRAAGVAAFLESLGDADTPFPAEPLDDASRDALVGNYVFGEGATDRFAVTTHPRFGLQLAREQRSAGRIVHLGRRVFHPVGSSAVRISFAAGTPSTSLVIVDGDIRLTATRV